MTTRTTLMLRALPIAIVSTASIACGGEPKPEPRAAVSATPPPATTTAAEPSPIPPPGAPKPLQPKPVFQATTKDGLEVVGITSAALPIVHVRIVVRAGNAAAVLATDQGKGGPRSRAGIAGLTAELLKDGGAGRWSPRELGERIDELGTSLTTEIGPDRVVFGLAVTKDKLEAALELLGAVVTKPRMDPGEFQKLKARELDRVRQAQKGSGSWAGRSALYREIFGAGHPYAEIDANDETLKSIELADVRAFYKKTYVQGASFVVVAGDVDQADVVARIEKHVALPKGAAPTIDFPPPKPANAPRVVLARRPGAKQSDIFVGGPTLDRRDPSWPAMALATATLGDGMSSRLFLDVREKRSLAYSTNAGAREFANGPAVVVLYAGTQTAQTPRSVTALFEHLGWISGGRPVEPKELALSKSKTETSFLFRLETIGAVASLAVEQKVLGLPGRDVYDYVAGYRTALREAPLEAVRSTAATKFAPAGYVLAVAGDPSLAAPLRRFGSVKIVDPENGFAVVETLPADPAASLEVPAP